MNKYYKVIKENFLWEVGAILENNMMCVGKPGYAPINNTDLWDKTDNQENEYITSPIIESQPDYFQRVYPVNLLARMVYKIKSEALEIMNNDYHE